MAFTISSRKIKSCGKRSLLLAVLLTVCIGLCGGLTSCGDDDFKSLPREIQQFISQYFPGQGVANYNESAGTYTVNLENSATLVFNPSLKWTTVDGNGNTIPQQLIFDQFPSQLYDYIETTDNLGEVYAVSRNAGIYMVTFHGYIISYDVASGKITPVVTGSDGNG